MTSEETKKRILEIAGPIFAQKGFSGTTVRKICEAAKVNQAAINYYFAGKENLYREVFKAFTPFGDGDFTQEKETLSLKERLRLFFSHRLHVVLATEVTQWQIQLILHEVNDPTAGCEDILKNLMVYDFGRVQKIFSWHLEGDVPEDILWKLTFAVFGLFSYYRSANHTVREMVSQKMWDTNFQPDQVADFLVDFFMNGIANYISNKID